MKPATHKPKKDSYIQPLTLYEVKLLLNSVNERDRLIYSIGAFMGLRLTEILYIELKDIDFSHKKLNYRVAKSDEITNRLFPEIVWKWLINYIKTNNLWYKKYLFTITKGCFKGNRLQENSFSKRTKEIFLKLNIGSHKKYYKKQSKWNPIKKASKHSKTFHSLRHFYATEYYRISNSPDMTARALRHSRGNIKTAMQYYVEIECHQQELEIGNSLASAIIN